MNTQRVKFLLDKIRENLSMTEGAKTINIFDFFEVIEHVGRSAIKDPMLVTSCTTLGPISRPVPEYVTSQEFVKLYKLDLSARYLTHLFSIFIWTHPEWVTKRSHFFIVKPKECLTYLYEEGKKSGRNSKLFREVSKAYQEFHGEQYE